jgi:acyl carrier protein
VIMNNLTEKLTDIFREVFDDDSIVLRNELTADDVENWDSLTHINLIVAIEKEFKVRFTTGEVSGLKNVGDLVSLVSRKISA